MRVMPDDFELLVDAVNALRVGPSLARVVDNQSPQGRPGWLLIEPVSLWLLNSKAMSKIIDFCGTVVILIC